MSNTAERIHNVLSFAQLPQLQVVENNSKDNNFKPKIDKEFKNILRPLKEEEYKHLERTIKENGCLDPIKTWKGFIIDGFNRYEICNKHGIQPKYEEVAFKSREDVISWIVTQQLGRRNISRYEIGKIAIKYLKPIISKQKKENQRKAGGDKKSNQYKASVTGMSEQPIKDREDDTYKTLSKSINNIVTADALRKIDYINNKKKEDEEEKIISGKTTINKVYKTLRRQENNAKTRSEALALAKEYDENKNSSKPTLYNKDLRNITDIDIAPESASLVLTDPAYGEKYLDLWTPLSEIANRILKPSGFLVAYAGNTNVYKKMLSLAKHLTYHSQLVLRHSSHQKDTCWKENISGNGKILLVFQRLPYTKFPQRIPLIIDDKYDGKVFHEWQQGIYGAEYLIDKLTKPNDLVVDLCMGSGTTIAAAIKLKRKAVGVEIDSETFEEAKGRLVEFLVNQRT